jgi:hypothetical protein
VGKIGLQEQLGYGQASGGGEDGLVAGVEGGAEQKYAGDTASYLSEICGLFGVKGTTEERELAIAEPLLENLVTPERVIPDIDRDRRPERFVVDMNIDTPFPKKGDCFFECQ